MAIKVIIYYFGNGSYPRILYEAFLDIVRLPKPVRRPKTTWNDRQGLFNNFAVTSHGYKIDGELIWNRVEALIKKLKSPLAIKESIKNSPNISLGPMAIRY